MGDRRQVLNLFAIGAFLWPGVVLFRLVCRSSGGVWQVSMIGLWVAENWRAKNPLEILPRSWSTSVFLQKSQFPSFRASSNSFGLIFILQKIKEFVTSASKVNPTHLWGSLARNLVGKFGFLVRVIFQTNVVLSCQHQQTKNFVAFHTSRALISPFSLLASSVSLRSLGWGVLRPAEPLKSF